MLGSVLSDSFFEHLPAQGRRTLALVLSIAQQLTQLLLLLFIKLVGLGTKEFSFQIGNDRLGLGQLLRLERQFLLRLGQSPLEPGGILQQPGRIIGQLPQDFFRGLHPWSTCRKPRHNG